MFGMSRDERRRLDEAERIARESRDAGVRATADLTAHTQLCTERHNTINGTLGEIKGALRWANRQGVLILLMVLGAILMQLALKHGLL